MANNKEFVVKNGLIVSGDAVVSGTITITSDPLNDLQVATKHYVDINAGVQTVMGRPGPDITLTANDVGLGAVDNKNSETIRSEINFENVTNALGFTPINSNGDFVNGALLVPNPPVNALQVTPKVYVDTQVNAAKFNVVGEQGQILYLNQDGSDLPRYEDNIKVAAFVSSDAELQDAKDAFISPAMMYDTWAHISHSPTIPDQPAVPSELNSLAYDSASSSIISSQSTTSLVGMVSNNKYDVYHHSVKLSSTSSDNDLIGVVLAYNIDSNGHQNTLTAVRSRGGSGANKVWSVFYNVFQEDELLIADGSDLAPGTDDLLGWDIVPDGSTVNVLRTGDVFTVSCSQFDSTTLDPLTELTVDLTTNENLEQFRGPKAYGYVVYSQIDTTFSDITVSEQHNTIYDVRNGFVYVSDADGNYTVSGTTTLTATFGLRRMLFNPTTVKLFYILENGSIVQLNSSQPGSVQTANAMRLGVVQIGAGLSITPQGVISANVPSLSLATPTVSGIVKVGSGLATTTDGILSINKKVITLTGDTIIDPSIHNNTYLRYNGTTNITITLPSFDSSVPFTTSHEYEFVQANTGLILFSSDTANLYPPLNGFLVDGHITSGGRGAILRAKLVEQNGYDFTGQST